MVSYSHPVWFSAFGTYRYRVFIRSVSSVFFGGGTPSLAQPSTIAAILETVSRRVNLSDKVEVTLEVNPTPVGLSKLEDFCHAGVNRFSIGIQVWNVITYIIIIIIIYRHKECITYLL